MAKIHAIDTGSTVMTKILSLCLISAALLSATGCYKEGGKGISLDLYTYKSTSQQPKTLTLVDTRTGEAIWTADVPVGQQLVVRFYGNANKMDYYTDTMKWGIMPNGRVIAGLPNAMPVPGRIARRLDMTLRSVPEMPALTSAEPVVEVFDEPYVRAPEPSPAVELESTDVPSPEAAEEPAETVEEPMPADVPSDEPPVDLPPG